MSDIPIEPEGEPQPAHRPRIAVDVSALHRGKEMISFARSYVMFIVQGHPTAQSQRMTVGSSAIFSGGGLEDELVTLVEDLMGGRAYDPKQLIATPTYGYRMVLSKEDYAIYREYMPPRSAGGDSFGRTEQLFSDYWWTIKSRPARLLTDANEIEHAVREGHLINGFVRSTLGTSGRTCTLQFPIRYFSVTAGDQPRFHAEAGPVLVPRAMLGDSAPESADGMCIAQFAFNRWDEAELAIWDATGPAYAPSRWFCRICKLSAELYFLAQQI